MVKYVIETEIGENWSIYAFECPTSRLDVVLQPLWNILIQLNKLANIPHDTIRATNPQIKSAIISLRVLRNQCNMKDLLQLGNTD